MDEDVDTLLVPDGTPRDRGRTARVEGRLPGQGAQARQRSLSINTCSNAAASVCLRVALRVSMRSSNTHSTG